MVDLAKLEKDLVRRSICSELNDVIAILTGYIAANIGGIISPYNGTFVDITTVTASSTVIVTRPALCALPTPIVVIYEQQGINTVQDACIALSHLQGIKEVYCSSCCH